MLLRREVINVGLGKKIVSLLSCVLDANAKEEVHDCRSLALHNDGACDAFQVEAMNYTPRGSVRVRVALAALVLWRRGQQRADVELDWETHTGTYAGDCNEDGNEAEGRSLPLVTPLNGASI